MSQSDEHESAIIENENNSNKVMESQGGLASSAADRSNSLLADSSLPSKISGVNDDTEEQEEECMETEVNEETKSVDLNVTEGEKDASSINATDQPESEVEEESMSESTRGNADEAFALPEDMSTAAENDIDTEFSDTKADAGEIEVDDSDKEETPAEEEREERETIGETEDKTDLESAAFSPEDSPKEESENVVEFKDDEPEKDISDQAEVETLQDHDKSINPESTDAEVIGIEMQSSKGIAASPSRGETDLSEEGEDGAQSEQEIDQELETNKHMDEDDIALRQVGQIEDSLVTAEEERRLLSEDDWTEKEDTENVKQTETNEKTTTDDTKFPLAVYEGEEGQQEKAEQETSIDTYDPAPEDSGERDESLGASVEETEESLDRGDSDNGEKATDGMAQEETGDRIEPVAGDLSIEAGKEKLTTSESIMVDEAVDADTSRSDLIPSHSDEMGHQESDAETLPENEGEVISTVEGEETKTAESVKEKVGDTETHVQSSEDESAVMETDEPIKGTEDKEEEASENVSQKSETMDEKEIQVNDELHASINKTSVQAPPEEDDDVVVLDDDDDDETIASTNAASIPVKREILDKTEDSAALFNSSNDMGIQIESVSGGVDELHDLAEEPSKQENGTFGAAAADMKKESSGTSTTGKKLGPKTQTCIVCKRVGKCKYNIVRNGDIKHLCDDTCFQRFRTNPTMYLKGTLKKEPVLAPAPLAQPPTAGKGGQAGYKTCVVCQLMNINTQGQFCMWKGLDFCGENCLGKFQASLRTSCAMCTTYIPLTARSDNCLRIGSEVRPFCSHRCYSDYKQRMRLCAFCQKDLSSASDSFSAPVGSDGAFKDFCSQGCMKKYEDLLSSDVEIIRVEQGKARPSNKCSVCQKVEISKHTMKYGGQIHHLCSDPCLSAFQYANKLDMNSCDQCGTLCTTLESSPHLVQFEGQQKRFCSDTCVNSFRTVNRKISPCAWCGSKKSNFDMIERLDSNNKFQLFCSLNCLSLYRVNLQAKSNQSVTCDQCLKFVPAQYHLTMSDASVRNFCSYTCVMAFQSQFTSKGVPPPSKSTPDQAAAKHRHNTRGNTQQTVNQPSFPIISNVVSLAAQGGQKVNIKSPGGIPVVVSGSSQTVKATGLASTAGGLVQQQIIIQPPPPKVVKNKSLLCKPYVQTKATSCRPHTQTRECQTDEVKSKPTLIPVPVPVYLPVPCAMYSAPTPTPIFVPIPIPVPVFIPTTRRSANGIMKHIKEIQEKIPTDPLEAEILMMAAAVATDTKHSSDSDSDDDDMLQDIGSKRKAIRGGDDDEEDDDNDADVMPLPGPKEGEVGGEEDMIQMALRMAEEMSGPIADLESAVEAVPINTEPPPAVPRTPSPAEQVSRTEQEFMETRSSRGRGNKRGSTSRRSSSRAPKRPRVTAPQPEVNSTPVPPEAIAPQLPPADANYHLKFTYGVNAWRHWVLFKNAQLERAGKRASGRIKLFKTDILQCTADELNYSLCLFVKEVRKPNGDEYSPDSIYYLCLGIQQYLFENGRIDNIFTDLYYEKFTECLTDILSRCQPKFNAAGQMVCRIEEEHLWECKQLGAHSPYVLLNTLIYFHTKYFMLKTPEDHMKLSFAHILKYWKKGQPGKGGQPTRSVSLRYYSVSTAKKDGSAPTSTTKKGSKEGIPVYEVTENQENPLRCPVKLYEFYLSKCPESIKNRSDIFYPIPERSCVPDSPVWYSTTPIGVDTMTKMLTRILLVREIQEAHLHAQPIYV